ncbi:PREDICTED: uncharacterized protein LOC108372710 [Rhagoletis zephyria]|uniref:uncharacterized protein LOC108372710 n=1 Tax=Rhagoletis zephyria TaxID=28612 RepID=UPI00081125DF|nr:PREDICTED: uncharacterized protein LOC108372710 [Rhagoletis zephyria]
MYLDANNLYGWAMSEYLPYAEFEWLDNVNDFDVFTIEENSSYGVILEVDLEYPHSIHDIHNDLPFCCENKKIGSMIQPKLIADLNNKTRYVIHYRNLQQCLKHGLKLKKIHRVLRFKQSNWLKKYIDLNTFHRTNAKNDFEKNFFKLLNNAVYGKTMENVDKRKDIKIVCEWESIGKRLGARALIAKPNFHSYTSFTENMLAIQLKRSCTLYDKPIYIGFVVLELSKWKMYNFHYSYMKPKFQTKLCLNYMDTDSFIYTIQTNDFYKDIHDDIDLKFDTSEYLENNVFNFPLKNKKCLGMMKDENNGKIMKEFIGLKPKMYSISVEGDNDVKKAKGVKKSALINLNIMNYKECLLQNKIFYDKMYTFRSKIHEIYTIEFNKVVLSNIDDKRFVLDDNINTLGWGHYKINNLN